ncbi:MAG: pantoate--beta-alanine ligase [Candidatus Marinimicrobia bacterium]|nr:pantoate--beta-alanine ligase [Candidatus Neomarinimicrobiota bacterium]
MIIGNDVKQWQSIRRQDSVDTMLGFVPTMGALHQGHLSLVNRSLQENDKTVVSIFLNPTQFNDPKDLSGYPQTLEQDIAALETAGVDVLLLPDFEQVYPDNYRYKLIESEFSQQLCGASRPGHFDGVLTVVMKLLNIVQAHNAYFGEKDYQQYVLIKEMAEAFFLRTKIIACPTVREADGLAFSSRNARLATGERILAPFFHKTLTQDMSVDSLKAQLESYGFKVDYLEELSGRRYGAVYLGKVRLIDNVAI